MAIRHSFFLIFASTSSFLNVDGHLERESFDYRPLLKRLTNLKSQINLKNYPQKRFW